MKILAEYSVPYLRGVIEQLGEVTYLPSEEFSPETVADKDWLIIRSITKCTPQLLSGSAVKLITTATIGYDHIDTDYCRAHNIAWFNAPGCNSEAVGQWFGSICASLEVHEGFEPKGKVLGIVGVGHVGKVIERYARALGMQVLRNDPPRAEAEGDSGFVSPGEIISSCDLITFHTPLTRGGKYPTYHLCNDELVRGMRRNPLVINACRGAVTDTSALLSGLEKGVIRDVILDCWEGEPEVSPSLLTKALRATPHIAGFSADGKANGARTCVENGIRFFSLPAIDLSSMTPPPPEEPIIELEQWRDHRIANALLHTLDLTAVEQKLRRDPDTFESLRRGYSLPREPHAYVVRGYTPEEGMILKKIGFRLG